MYYLKNNQYNAIQLQNDIVINEIIVYEVVSFEIPHLHVVVKK